MQQAQMTASEGVKSGSPGGPKRILTSKVDAEAPSSYYHQIITSGGEER